MKSYLGGEDLMLPNAVFPTEVQDEAAWMTLGKETRSSPRPSAFHRSQLAELQKQSHWTGTHQTESVSAVPQSLHRVQSPVNHKIRSSKKCNVFRVFKKLGMAGCCFILGREFKCLSSRG